MKSNRIGKILVYSLLPVSLLFLLKASQSPKDRIVNENALTGNISLTLKHGVWKLWQEKPVYQDITIDLVCDRGRCEPEVWGFAPKFNQDVDHQGTVKVIDLENTWQLQIELKIQASPWHPQTEEATYTLEVIPVKNTLIGSYFGRLNQHSVKGKVTGIIEPRWPKPIANYQPIRPREHPRLIFRDYQLPALREKAKTPVGQAILAQLKKTLNQPIYDKGYVPNGGYHAAGYCFLSVLNQDAKAAETAWQIVEKSMRQSQFSRRLLEKSPIVAGVALAYDLCYQDWSEERLKTVTPWLSSHALWLIRGDSPTKGWNSSPWSNWNARARGAAGLAALAILDEPQEFLTEPLDVHRLAIIARRNIQRYLTTAIGDRGFGSEGDHYTTEPWVLTLFPFLQADQNVLGQDLSTESNAQWILPQYLLRSVNQNGELTAPTYGRHRSYAGGSLFASGLGTVPQQWLPGVMGLYRRYLGMEGDQTFGINSPYQAAYVLAAYRDDIIPTNPAASFERVLVDERQGFYVFRNQWQDSNDFVASVYLKQQFLPDSWSFPDVGSFRIWGLGGHWANPGPSDGH